MDTGEAFLQIMYLPAPFNTITNRVCIPIAAFYWTQDVGVAIHKVDGSKVLKRWVVNLDDNQIFPITFSETKHVCFIFDYNNQYNIQEIREVSVDAKNIIVSTESNNPEGFEIVQYYHNPAPPCDITWY